MRGAPDRTAHPAATRFVSSEACIVSKLDPQSLEVASRRSDDRWPVCDSRSKRGFVRYALLAGVASEAGVDCALPTVGTLPIVSRRQMGTATASFRLGGPTRGLRAATRNLEAAPWLKPRSSQRR